MIFDFANLQVSGMIVSAEGVGFEPTDHGWDHDQRFSRTTPKPPLTCSDAASARTVSVSSPQRVVVRRVWSATVGCAAWGHLRLGRSVLESVPQGRRGQVRRRRRAARPYWEASCLTPLRPSASQRTRRTARGGEDHGILTRW